MNSLLRAPKRSLGNKPQRLRSQRHGLGPSRVRAGSLSIFTSTWATRSRFQQFAVPHIPVSPVRHFRVAAPQREAENLAKEVADRLQGASKQQIYEWTSIGLAGGFPVALLLSPSILNVPVDISLGVLIPLHSHIGMQAVIEDYVPKQHQMGAKGGLFLLSLFLALGLLKLNMCGDGITETLKQLWRKPKPGQPKPEQ